MKDPRHSHSTYYCMKVSEIKDLDLFIHHLNTIDISGDLWSSEDLTKEYILVQVIEHGVAHTYRTNNHSLQALPNVIAYDPNNLENFLGYLELQKLINT